MMSLLILMKIYYRIERQLPRARRGGMARKPGRSTIELKAESPMDSARTRLGSKIYYRIESFQKPHICHLDTFPLKIYYRIERLGGAFLQIL